MISTGKNVANTEFLEATPAVGDICCLLWRKIMRKKILIPYLAFVLCIAVQLRILSTVPSTDIEKTSSKVSTLARQLKGNGTTPVPSLSTRYLDDSKLLNVRHDWIQLSHDLVSISRGNTSSKILQQQIDELEMSSRSFGYSQGIKGILTIGIILNDEATLQEFIRTVDFIVEDNARENTFVVLIYLSTCSTKKDMEAGKTIHKRYPELYALGQMRIINAPFSLYRAYGITEENGCSSGEIRRRKETLDYALLFQYARNMSLYYVQYETGMKCTKRIISKVLTLVAVQKSRWFAVDFGHFGFIGTLFHSSFLTIMADFLAAHHETSNSQSLLTQLFESFSKKTILYMNSSPCTQKDSTRLQRHYRRKHGHKIEITKGDNPTAKILTNMEVFKNFASGKAYDNNNDTFMWCNAVQRDQFFRLIFEKPVNISRIVVLTGADDGSDILKSGFLRVGIGLNSPCDNLVRRGVFVQGNVDTKDQGILKLPSNIGCVSIDVTHNQSDWLMIREIRIYLAK